MTVQITSTTDSQEAVAAAMGLAKPESKDEASAPEAKEASEQKPASESEPEAKEESEATSEESDDSESQEGDSEKTDEPEKDKPKKKGGFQRRIDKLNSQKAEAQREAEYWRAKALGGKQTAEEPQKPTNDKPKASEGKPSPDDFESHTEYVEALTDWKTEQKFKAKEQDERNSQLQRDYDSAVKAHFERVEAFKEKNPDFMSAVEEIDDIQHSPTVEQMIISSDVGPELIYELAKNREEYERINKLPPLAAARELGKIEERLASSESKKPNKLTKAPKPLTPVSSKGGGASKSLDEMDYQEYKKAREQQLKKRA